MTDDRKCKKCGRCCYSKLWIGDKIYYTPVPCEYLDTEKNLCTVYTRRHEVNPQCLNVEEGIKLGVFPADCPYVQDIPGYQPPVTDLVDEHVMKLIEKGRIMDEHGLEKLARKRARRLLEKSH